MEEKNIEKNIMEKIKSGKVSLRSKYIFLAEKLGFSSILIFSIILSVLFLSLILFYFKSTDNLIYLSFGSRGLFAFLESFPIWLVIIFTVLIFLVGSLLTKTEFVYKKPFSFIAIIFLLFIFISGSILAFTSINKKLEYHFFNPNSKIGQKFKPFAGNMDKMRDHSIAGMVLYFGYPEAVIQLPMFESEIILELDNLENIYLNKGDFVVVSGNKVNEIRFEASDLKVVEENEMFMIQNRIKNMIEKDCGGNTSTKCRIINEKNSLNISDEECFGYCVHSDWESKILCDRCMGERLK